VAKSKMYHTTPRERQRASELHAEWLERRRLASDEEVADIGYELEEEERERYLDQVEGPDRDPDPTAGEREEMRQRVVAQLAKWR